MTEEEHVSFSSPPLPVKQRRVTALSMKRWSAEEDNRLRSAVIGHESNNWKKIAALFPGRSPHQCLQRWYEVLRPDLVKGPWNEDEDRVLKEHVTAQGPRNWADAPLVGRSSSQCRERWRKLSMGGAKENCRPVDAVAAISKLSSPLENDTTSGTSALDVLSSVCASLSDSSIDLANSNAASSTMSNNENLATAAKKLGALRQLPAMMDKLAAKAPISNLFLRELHSGFQTIVGEKIRRHDMKDATLSLREILAVIKATALKKQAGIGNFSSSTVSETSSAAEGSAATVITEHPAASELVFKKKRRLEVDHCAPLKKKKVETTYHAGEKNDTARIMPENKRGSVIVLPAWALECDFTRDSSLYQTGFRNADSLYRSLCSKQVVG